MSYAPFPLVWGGSTSFAFGVIETDFGTYPTATGTSDVLTLVSANPAKYYFTGTALTDTITLTINESAFTQDFVIEDFVLDASAISSKKITLASLPKDNEGIRFIPLGGLDQRLGIDYNVTSSDIIWNGLTLDGFLEVGDNIRIIYQV